MSRGAASNGVNAHHNGDERSNAPPSTITAQLVEHHSETNVRSQPHKRATFCQLLEEIRSSPETVETDVRSNHKLISVVSEAGLDDLAKDDPFAGADDTATQAVACLDVIEIAFSRSRNVLFHHEPGTSSTGSPLCLWLVPKMLMLLKHSPNDRLHARVRELLTVFLDELAKDHDRWEDLLRLLQLYQCFADDALASIMNTPLVGEPPDSIDLLLPSPETRSAFCDETQQPVALPSGNQVRIFTVVHAFSVIATLVHSVALNLKVMSNQALPLDPALLAAQRWTVRALNRLWKRTVVGIIAEPSHDLASSPIITTFLTVCQQSASAIAIDARCESCCHQMALLLVTCTLQISSRLSGTYKSAEYQRLAENITLLVSFAKVSSRIFEEVRTRLLPYLKDVQLELSAFEQTSEFHKAAATAIPYFSLSGVPPHSANESDLAGLLSSSDAQRRTGEVSTRPHPDQVQDGLQQRPRKRQRLEKIGNVLGREPTVAYKQLSTVCSVLGNWDPNNLDGLAEAAGDLFSDLSAEQKRKVLSLLAEIPCAGQYTTSDVHGLQERREHCHSCDSKASSQGEGQTSYWSENYWDWFYQILVYLTNSKAVHASTDYRILCSLAVRRLISHSPLSSHSDLAGSPLGKACLQNMRSSHREVRLAAVYTLPFFLRLDENAVSPTRKKNRITALDFLRQLSDTEDSKTCETLILAFGQVGSVCGDDELNLVLLRLVEYLGHANPLVCGFAHAELRRLASESNISLDDLFKPFWRTIAITAFKDLHSRPQKAQQLSDLLGVSVNQLLVRTQSETVPYLVLWKNKNTLQKVASASGSTTTIWDVCMEPRNRAAILSLLLAQNPSDTEASIAASLSVVVDGLGKDDISGLLKADAVSIACELLKMAGDETGDSRERLLEGFRSFSYVVELRGQQSKTAATQTKLTANFFQNHALGMMASFSDVVENPQQSSAEKKRCLRGVEQMISTARASINFALPQIRACLQSALGADTLRDLSFCAWAILLSVLEAPDDLEAIIEPTFANIVQHWNAFSSSSQQAAYDVVAALLKNHGNLVQDTVLMIPSLESIPMMSKFESQLSRLREPLDESQHFQAFARRCRDENATVVAQALRELLPYLENHQGWIHESALSDQPSNVVSQLIRSLLDTCVRFGDDEQEISGLCAQCLGIVGCLDPNRIETIREKHEMLVLSNFTQATEAVDFVTFLLEHILVKAFFSVSNPRAQGFLAFVMQELLRFCGFSKEATQRHRPQGSQADDTYVRWMRMPESVRATLRPFLSSRYVLTANSARESGIRTYPIFSPDMSHGTWLRDFVFDLLQRSVGDNARMIFSVLSRVIRGYDVSIAGFLLPFAAANLVIGGATEGVEHVSKELLAVLVHQQNLPAVGTANSHKLCSENVFQILDYLSRWLQAKRKLMMAGRYLRDTSAQEQRNDEAQVRRVESVLSAVPAPVISRRAVECGSFSRALFHWEDHMRQRRQKSPWIQGLESEDLFQQLQEIYANIDEPDGIDGISAHLHVLTGEQKALEHRRGKRWAAAQSWYEFELVKQPDDLDRQINLMTCLQEAGLFHIVLEHAKHSSLISSHDPRILSMVSEAAWRTESWSDLRLFLKQENNPGASDFNVGLGSSFLALKGGDRALFWDTMQRLRTSIIKDLSVSTTASLQTCHSQLLKLHALYEVGNITEAEEPQLGSKSQLQTRMMPRLDTLGSYVQDKQYLLGIRRAAMAICGPKFPPLEMSASWMLTAKLARKNGSYRLAYDAVTRALQLGDRAAQIEEARLLWSEGEHRRAIHILESAIETDAFGSNADVVMTESAPVSAATMSRNNDQQQQQNLLVAKAHLLLAKWLDQAGQTQARVTNEKYQFAAKSYSKWEKGFYCLGRYYNKLIESEKSLAAGKQSQAFLGGETAKLVVENYLRSLMFGCKYLFETLPKLLTLWLDFGIEFTRPISKEVPDDVRVKATENRPKMLDTMNKQVKKYAERIPAYIYYTAISQLMSRLSHPNPKVYDVLAVIITKVVAAHPQQALWPLLAVAKSSVHDRSSRGSSLINKLRDNKSKNVRNEGQSVDMRSLVSQGQRLSEQLLQACEVNLDGRASVVSLSGDLRFHHRVAPCSLVVPLEQTLTASLPTIHDNAHIKAHKAFPASRDAVTISAFSDDVVVLNSLQKPRKLTVRGSDGRKYGLMCKPHDDLRKDQRLMEFNTMINRALKKDAESSKRRLYIKTYAVTPLNEACGLIEWVEGLKPMRDILLSIYKSRGVNVDYGLLRELLNEACSSPDGHRIFSDQILNMYKPVLYEWFTDLFPEPESWLAARLRYTRSCAVTSIVGHALGLGDRHGENVLLVENTGEVFHVDFNCLFDKGLTFEKPELVPFRLTHNMVDAFGAYGVEGPFRRSAECTMGVMRNHEDALLTILETFVYDPTADFVGARKRVVKGVPETPKEVLESVQSKVRGLMRGESVPLSVEGHVDALIRQATDPGNLCAMYIGWCAFF